MSDCKDIFRSVETQNWFKCCLAVLIAREGLVEFVKNEIDTFQQDCLQKVYNVNQVPPGNICVSCATHNLVPCHPNVGICQIRSGRCKFHISPWKPCPNNKCDLLRQEIEKEHHFRGPSWKNTDSKGWCVNSWELAKCFMPPDGYTDKPSVEATDFNGIISVMINCKRFENKLDDDLSQAVNLCTQARDVGKDVRHCADLKMKTVSMTQNISTLIDLLNDAKYLKSDAKVSEAVLKLEKLKTDSLAITTVDVKAVLDALLDDITRSAADKMKLSADKTQQAIDQSMSKKLQECKELMEKMDLETKRKMAESEKEHLDNLKQAGANLKTDINKEVDTVKKGLETARANLKTDINKDVGTAKKELETAGTNLKSDINKEIGAAKKELETAGANLKTDIKKEVGTAKKELETAGTNLKSDINKEVGTAKRELETAGTNLKSDINKEVGTAKKELETAETNLKTDIKKEVGTAKKELETAGTNLKSDINKEVGTAKKELETAETNLKTDIKKEVGTAKKELETAGTNLKSDIKKEVGTAKRELETAGTNLKSDINKEVGTAKKELETAGANAVSNFKTEINKEVGTARKEFVTGLGEETEKQVADARHKMTEDACGIIKDAHSKVIGMQQNETADVVYEKRKHELRQALAQYYLNRHSTMPLSPLMTEVDDQLNKLYVPFKMQKVDTKSTTKSAQTTPLYTYRSIFHDGEKCHSNIYIQGEAGMGKSTFCTKLALMWSETIEKEISRKDSSSKKSTGKPKQSKGQTSKIDNSSKKSTGKPKQNKGQTSRKDCSSNKSRDKPKQNEGQPFPDEFIINEFDFVFSFALRDVDDECDIETMINTQIVSELPDHSKYAGLVPTILDKERCLIILDGLDEWSHQKRSCKKFELIPHKKSWSKTTVLTSTRPWKMNEVRLKDSETSIVIQITGITEITTFIRNVLNCLNDKNKTTYDVRDFVTYIFDKKLTSFLHIPIVAMQVLWLWHGGHEIGDSKCQIYMNMLDMLFGRAHGQPHAVSEEHADTPQTELLSCFESTMYCKQHKMLLDSLGSLAFDTLHSSKREESLIFSDFIVEKHVKRATARKTALTTGILSQHKSPSRIARRSHYCFLHKTFQEFLAAYYVATHVDGSENIVNTLFQVYGKTVDILDILELFIFVCGLSTEMSFKISESIMKSFSNTTFQLIVSADGGVGVNNEVKSLQDMILAGYTESKRNGLQDPQLALAHVYYGKHITDDDMLNLDRMVNRNIDKIETLNANRCTVDIVKIQQILAQSSSTLSDVCLRHVEGLTDVCLDLLPNTTLKYIRLLYINTHFDIKLNTSNLLYCELCGINKELEHDVLFAITAAPQLNLLDIRDCKNMSVFCKVLPTLPMLQTLKVSGKMISDSLCQVLSTLSQLHVLIVTGGVSSLLWQALSTLSKLEDITIVDANTDGREILLPNLVQSIHLFCVTLASRSLRQLVDRLTQIPHQVTCVLVGCNVTPVKERDIIVKQIQQSGMFEIREHFIVNNALSFHFTKSGPVLERLTLSPPYSPVINRIIYLRQELQALMK